MFGEYVAKRVLGKPTDPALTEAFRIPTTTYEEERKAEEAAKAAGQPAPARRPGGDSDYWDDV
ncbi:MAG: hypothetical protein IPK85_15245 [Gemmatimonadetes bacterium]|nr:hypothetical protein [Gemmatimonadota bacterium]